MTVCPKSNNSNKNTLKKTLRKRLLLLSSQLCSISYLVTLQVSKSWRKFLSNHAISHISLGQEFTPANGDPTKETATTSPPSSADPHKVESGGAEGGRASGMFGREVVPRGSLSLSLSLSQSTIRENYVIPHPCFAQMTPSKILFWKIQGLPNFWKIKFSAFWIRCTE